MNSVQSYNEVVKELEVGDTYPISFLQAGEAYEGTFRVKANPSITLEWIETVNDTQASHRADWLKLN